MNTFTLGACFQHELHTGPYFMTFAPRLYVKPLNLSHFQISCRSEQTRQGACFFTKSGPLLFSF